jgi:hypothetical protein
MTAPVGRRAELYRFPIRIAEQTGEERREHLVEGLLPDIDLSCLDSRFPKNTRGAGALIQGILEPAAAVGVADLRTVRKAGVIFEEGLYRERPFTTVAAAVWTIGGAADRRVEELFLEGNQVEGLKLDTAACMGVILAGNCVRERIMDLFRDHPAGKVLEIITPGKRGIPLHLQKLAAVLSRSEEGIAVSASSKGILDPVKSGSALFLVGEGPAVTSYANRCTPCEGERCLIYGMGLC